MTEGSAQAGGDGWRIERAVTEGGNAPNPFLAIRTGHRTVNAGSAGRLITAALINMQTRSKRVLAAG